tara:strand:- start:159 stop:1022 length:864 start_codon:yes stop_codon:yes gene_type:complete
MKINNFFYYPAASISKIIIYRLKNLIEIKLKIIKQFFLYYKLIKKVKKLKNTKKNQKAFVFANGPSLNILSPDKINKINYDIFVVNKFINQKEYSSIEPNFYVLSDPGYFDHTNEDHEIVKKISSKNKLLFCPFNFISKKEFSNSNIYGFCDIEDHLDSNVQDITKPRGYLSATAYKALSIAIYLGYSEIFICGIDNNQILQSASDSQNNLFYKSTHFYKKKQNDKDSIIDIKKYWPSIGYMMYTEHFLFNDLEKFSQLKKTKIINLDKESLNISFSKDHNLDIYKE